MGLAKLMDQGENRVLNILFGTQDVDTVLYLGLYKNVAALAEDAALTGLEEPVGFGYARIAVSRGSWTISGASATYPAQTFLADGGDWGDITGYFLGTTVNNTGKLLFTEHLDAAIEVTDGKGIKVTLTVQAR
jgi:hypothetical protein